MSTHHKIHQTQRAIARLERSLSLEKVKQRKAETRRKIELGGLVVKADMDAVSKDVLLGALIQLKKELDNDPSAIRLYQAIGEAAFMGYGE